MKAYRRWVPGPLFFWPGAIPKCGVRVRLGFMPGWARLNIGFGPGSCPRQMLDRVELISIQVSESSHRQGWGLHNPAPPMLVHAAASRRVSRPAPVAGLHPGAANPKCTQTGNWMQRCARQRRYGATLVAKTNTALSLQPNCHIPRGILSPLAVRFGVAGSAILSSKTRGG